MPALIIRTALAVNPDALDRFLEVAEAWVAATESESGTVGYHLYLDREALRAIFLEHYADDAAFIAHRDAIAPELRTALYQTCSVDSFEVYGDPSGPAREALAAAPTFGHVRSK